MTRRRRRAGRVNGEQALAVQCRLIQLVPVAQFRFHPIRRWRFDLAFPSQKLAVEVDGGLHTFGRHVRGAGRERDMERDAEALCLGWTVLRVSPKHVIQGVALDWIARILSRLPVVE